MIERASPEHAGPKTTSTFRFELGASSAKRDQTAIVTCRLIKLQKMGLATQLQPGLWDVRSDFVTVLKAMQQVADRQKTLSAHRALVSDERLPLVVTEPRRIKHLEGRVLGHGENESGNNFGKHYMLLEGTDAKIHLIYYTSEMEEARSRGQLGANSFIQLCKRFENGRPMLEVANLGDAEELINTKRFRIKLASRSGSEASAEMDWGGWLGRYYAQVAWSRDGQNYERTLPQER